ISENEYKEIPKLTAVTYAVWKRAMTMALQSEGCLKIIENEEDQPDPPESLPEESIPEDQQAHARATREYKEEWKSYRNRYGKAGWLINQSLTRSQRYTLRTLRTPLRCGMFLKTKCTVKIMLVYK